MWWVVALIVRVAVRVVDDEVGVRADRDRALPRVHPEQLRRRRRDDLDPALLRDPAADDAAVVEQVDPVLDAGQAVRDLPEVAPAELLLAVEVERAVVGRDDLEVVLDAGPVQSSSWWSAGRSGGEQTNLAPSNPLPRSSSERNRYCGQVSAKAVDAAVAGLADRVRARRAPRGGRCRPARPAASARRITRFVASPSKIG